MNLLKVYIVSSICCLVSSLSLSEPKDYQRILMNEPVSMFDLMIHNNRTEFQRKDDDQRYFFETTESWSTKRFKLMRKFLNEDPFLYDEFDWDVKPAKNEYYIAVPLLYKYRNVQFLFDQGLVEFSMRMSWDYDKRIERSDTFIKQKARLKLTQSNIAKLCEIQLIRVSFNKVEPLRLSFHTGHFISVFVACGYKRIVFI